jgi:hypothetical protein
MVIHAALLVEAQTQLDPAVTVTVPLPPFDEKEALAGEMEYVQPAGAAWVIVKVWPAIVNVPVRELVLVLAATE